MAEPQTSWAQSFIETSHPHIFQVIYINNKYSIKQKL